VSRAATLLIGAVGVGLLALITPAVLMMIVMTGGNIDVGGTCSQTGVTLVAASASEQLDASQRANAATVIQVGQQLGVPDQGIVVALATARQESAFRNYANDGLGSDLVASQRRIAASLRLPHDAVGTDHGSLGVFQQQWPLWGTIRELMTPAMAAQRFYTRLLRVPGWERMTVTEAAQAVQRSAHPDAYADDVPIAYELLTGQHPPDAESAASALSVAGGDCSTIAPGQVAYPLPPGTSSDLRNFGHTSALWATVHTGTDLAAACGTPVLAATNGTVVIRTDQPWSGNWLVEVSTGAGQLTTWYGHMQELDVTDGQAVTAGQQLGQVGSLGNATRCHLHFEVHPHGGGYGQDDIDPSSWLTQYVGPEGPVQPVAQAGAATGATLIAANVGRTMSADRASGQIHGLLAHRPSVLILEEVRQRNVARIAATAPGHWSVWQSRPGTFAGEIAIVWDADEYTSIRQGVIPGYDGVGYDRWIPWTILRSATGQTLAVVGIHMPTGAYRTSLWRGYYRQMTGRLQGLLSQLSAAGYPPIAGGDWNASLESSRRSWGPVRSLEQVGFATNWLEGEACTGSTRIHGGRIDGFAYSPAAYQVVRQGCLDNGYSDHRPVWVEFQPVTEASP
jgi:murein DD-endopeptidase MepM/ murein hydrolase activator NlpD/exonuclease III